MSFYCKSIMILRLLFIVLSINLLSNSCSKNNEDLKQEALGLFSQGKLLFQNYEYNLAIDKWGDALTIFKKNNDINGIIECYLSIGFAKETIGKTDEALNYYRKALKQISVKNEKTTGIIKNSIGRLLGKCKKYPDAIKYCSQASKIFNKINDNQLIGSNLIVLGSIYYSIAEYQKSLNCYNNAIKAFQVINNEQGIGEATNNIGVIHMNVGNYSAARKCFKKSFDIANSTKDISGILSYYNNNGRILYLFQDYTSALSSYTKALKLIEAKGLASITLYKSLCLNIYNCYLELNDYHSAAAYLIKCDHPLPNEWGELHLKKGNYSLAIENFRRAIELENRGESRPAHLFKYYTNLGEALFLNEKLYDAAIAYTNAVDISENMRERLSIDLRNDFFTKRTKPYSGLVATLFEIHFKNLKVPEKLNKFGKSSIEIALYYMELSKARFLIENMSLNLSRAIGVSIPVKLSLKEKKITEQVSAYQNKLLISKDFDKSSYKENTVILEKYKQELSNFIDENRDKYPAYFSLKYPNPRLFHQLLKSNAANFDEVVLEFQITQYAIYSVLIKNCKIVNVFKATINKNDFEDIIDRYREPYEEFRIDEIRGISVDSSNNKIETNLGFKLYNLLLQNPLQSIGKNEHVIIIPDGKLSLVPFDALPIIELKNRSRHVGEDFAISYCPSISVLTFLRDTSKKRNKTSMPLFAVADPIFNVQDDRYKALEQKNKSKSALNILDNDVNNFSNIIEQNGFIFVRLPETKSEVLSIAKIAKYTKKSKSILTGFNANESVVKSKNLQKYKYLHFATHGILGEELPWVRQPALVLNLVGNYKDDGLLTMEEIFKLKLNADLVSLSACKTGIGKVKSGEGVSGLGSAFIYANAESVLVSLWSVESKSTEEFMVEFYKQLFKGKTKIEALKFAQNMIKKNYPNPFYWAPFILIGNYK